jgi:hypothetical protein
LRHAVKKAADGKVLVECTVYCAYRPTNNDFEDSIIFMPFVLNAPVPISLFSLEAVGLQSNETQTAEGSNRRPRLSDNEKATNQQTIEILVETFHHHILAARAWSCVVCHEEADDLHHAILPQFEYREVEEETTEAGAGLGSEAGGDDMITTGKPFMAYVPRIMDVVLPVCHERSECGPTAHMMGRPLTEAILSGEYKTGDPQNTGDHDIASASAATAAAVRANQKELGDCGSCGKKGPGLKHCGGCRNAVYVLLPVSLHPSYIPYPSTVHSHI